MRQFHNKAAALYRTGSRGGSMTVERATAYYLLEAEAIQPQTNDAPQSAAARIKLTHYPSAR
jgi:hypothetical protein